jgi:hypothetical protein
MIVLDIFKYFARFVPAAVLRKTFRIPDGDDYRALMEALLAEPSGREIEGITEYIFGTDPEKLATVISSVAGIYLFVEYDRISSTVNTATDRKDDRFHVAVTVACPVPDSMDLVSSAIINDKCLEILSSIRRRMREDDDLRRGIEWMDYPATLTVFASKALANSQGWSMEFDIYGIDMV